MAVGRQMDGPTCQGAGFIKTHDVACESPAGKAIVDKRKNHQTVTNSAPYIDSNLENFSWDEDEFLPVCSPLIFTRWHIKCMGLSSKCCVSGARSNVLSILSMAAHIFSQSILNRLPCPCHLQHIFSNSQGYPHPHHILTFAAPLSCPVLRPQLWNENV